jgi:hypothetical protein
MRTCERSTTRSPTRPRGFGAAPLVVEASSRIDVVAHELEVLRARSTVFYEGADPFLEDEHGAEMWIETLETAPAKEPLAMAPEDPGSHRVAAACAGPGPGAPGGLQRGAAQALCCREQRGEQGIALPEAHLAEGVVVVVAGEAGCYRLPARVAGSGFIEMSKAVHRRRL